SLTNGALGGALDDRTIGHGIGERNTELEDIGPRIDQRLHEARCGLWGRIAGGNVRDERRTVALFLERDAKPRVGRRHGEGVGSQVLGQRVMPLNSATVCMSLSPRPDRLTRMILSRGSEAASLAACARAWEDSSAGMMPSVRQHS